jgi:hypothetical protein
MWPRWHTRHALPVSDTTVLATVHNIAVSYNMTCKIWGSHSDLLGCDAVSMGVWLPVFWRKVVPPSSELSSAIRNLKHSSSSQCDVPEDTNTQNELIQCTIYNCNTQIYYNQDVCLHYHNDHGSTCSSYHTSHMKKQTTDMHALYICVCVRVCARARACIPNQTTGHFHVLPPAFVTCSSTQWNKQVSQALQTWIIKWLARSLFIKHVTYSMSDIVQCNINTHKTFYWHNKPRTTVAICQPCDMVYNRWTYIAGTESGVHTQLMPLKPWWMNCPLQNAMGPHVQHVTDNVCMWTPSSLQTMLLLPN